MENKINYELQFLDIISKLKTKPKLLLHVCCAPCSTACLKRLIEYFDVTLYFYNPNIDILDEYNLRAEQFKKFDCNVVIEKYNHDEFLSKVKGLENELEGGNRCPVCFKLRLEKTFEYAKLHNFDYVTTSLTISPHKDSQVINKIGGILQDNYKINYLFSDFKKKDGYLKSIKFSKEFNLYRQNYCGCEFSKTNN